MRGGDDGSNGRIGQLDTLRGAAALMVVVHHSGQAFTGSTADVWQGLASVLDLGRLGVVIFFMISGFVIAKAMPGSDLSAARLFWTHRFYRLYPPFWVSVALAAIVALLVGGASCCAFAEPVTPTILLANLTMLPVRFHQPMLLGIYWTLELEMLFYLLITGINLARRSRFAAMWGAASILFAGAVGAALLRVLAGGSADVGKDQIFLALLHLSLMFAGAALRYHWDEQADRRTFLANMPLPLLCYFGAMALFFGGVVAIKLRHGIDPHTFRVTLTYLLAIGTVLVSLRWFRGSWFGRVLGNRSYGIYLCHLPMLSLVSLAMARMPVPRLSYPSYLAVVLVLTLIAADLLRRFVERPAIRLAHRRLPSRTAAPALQLAPALVPVLAPARLAPAAIPPVTADRGRVHPL